ncbi:C2 domain-containing protein 3-like isoform X5 [Strigops habroptila]|uniref:C2 domain-containing protein 3-like isoform X5 n=1 Tax=Strigops habroptila TaxID=2489341 RepID=UPI0011CF569F|nr:C2 domain-containing protein 3-like isoform X5 [Strigops habroptila]
MEQPRGWGEDAPPRPLTTRSLVPTGLDDIPASTSLPPLVEGPLRCLLRCTVAQVLWTTPKPPSAATLVRLRWWGETSNGTIFQPTSRPGQPGGRTTARFPVRCGPRQFTAYLTDMGVLVLEVMTKLDHLPIGRAQITSLSQLSPSHPISGVFPVISPTSDKLGELQISLVLEPLPGRYDTSSSIPTTDGSLDTAPGSSKPQFLAPSQQSRQTRVTIADQEAVNNGRASTPRGKDHFLLQENSENIKDTFPAPHHPLILPDECLKVNPSNQQVSFPTSADPEGPARTNTRVLSLHNPATQDLLSALLDQGNKLRDAMVVSAMKSSPDMEIELTEVSPFIETDDFKAPAKNPKVLNSSFLPTPEDPHPLPSEVSGQQLDLNSEETAIELLLGGADFSPVPFWDRTGSLWDSLSLGSEVYDSELNDPHYDQSLLESLFYTAPKSDSSLSDLLSDDDDVNSSKKVTKTQTVKKADPRNPQKDSNAFDQDQKVTEIIPSHSPTRPLAPPEDLTEAARITSLGADRLALLERIHLARVIIESLKIPPESIQVTPRKKGVMGKPPRPASVNKCTFFVEYHFPVGASGDEKGQISITTEVIRIASSKITDDVVTFQQRFVFPVRFGGAMIEHWWSSALAFKIYMRKSTQKKPVAIGSAALQLRQVVQSELLTVSCEIPVDKEGDQPPVGPLKVSLELAANNKDFTHTTARSPMAAQQAPVHAVRSPGLEFQEPTRKSISPGSPHCLKLNHIDSQKTGAATMNMVQPPQAAPTSVAHHLLPQIATSGEDGLLLHVLLMVPDGKDFVAEDCGLPSSCNVYLNCKLLSTEEATRSAVVWGTTQPAFNFSQVMPFSLTSKHLERLKNNVMIIEVWNKMGSPGCDRLLGLVKLPLHQFYISFKDPKISHLLLQAQYPVVAVDSYMPVVDVFSGSRSGSLRVILAMGSADQVVALQRLKTEEGMVPPITQRPSHSLDPPPAKPVMQLDQEGEDLLEHVFEIHVESVKGLTPLQSTVWGEADCYVQYYFPVQEAGCGALQGAKLHEDGIKLKPFRTATTLCVPDPVFNDEHHHSLLVPADIPVQRLLVTAFTAPGVAGGGIQFEVWCRYYYPNVRDQVVAKGTLPLSRLCAMVTIQHREEIGIQTFNLPLVPRTDSSEEFHLRSSGLLDVSVRYQRSMRTAAGGTARAVSLAVQIHRAAGLQAAARAVAQKNPSLQYYAGVGVNAYVSVHLSFLPEAERRHTRAVACTFCPEFEHHIEFPCNLIIQKSSGEASCLGELLQSADIIFSIYHQSTKSATDRLAPRTSRDCLLGTVTIPTRDLLRRRSGISGWYPVTLSEDVMPPHSTNIMQAIVGGLELSVTFAHQDDRERVLEAAKLLGWNSEEIHEDSMDDSDEWQQSAQPVAVTISTPRVWLPIHCLLLAGQTHLNKSTYCYLRYKLYNQEATWTVLKRPKLSDDTKNVTINFKKPNKVMLRRSHGLLWFFREEKLEIQVWWAYGKENEVERPLDTDRLIGSAYVDLAALAERSRKPISVSGVYPLFRCNAANLAGAALRVHIILSTTSALPSRLQCAEEYSSSEDEGTEKAPALSQQVSENHSQKLDVVSSETTDGKPQEDDVVLLENTVAVNILVERAMHLSLKGSPLTEREVTAPSSCVSFAVAGADAPVTTSVIENTDSPVWDFQQEARLSKELLLDPQQTLVFKVWHKAETERVIGFASVDLSPLLSGFQLVCGWYNITDFSGQCRGQIKVAVSPLQNLTHLKEERQARIWSQPPSSAVKANIPTFPSNATSFSKQMNTLSKEASAPTRERTLPSGTHTPRHEEHMQNVRRFHESLQQAEGNAHRAAKMDSLSLSSRASLLTALRKNLSELDEVQRYFNQKLTRSFPDFSYGNTSKPSHEEQESDHPCSMSREVDPNGCHLLERSSQLVSQVSSLISDLQTITKTSKESSHVHQDSSRKLGATHIPSQRDDEAAPEVCQGQLELDSSSICSDTQQPCSFGRPVFDRHMLHELLDQAVPEEEHPLPTGCVQEDEGAFAVQPPSEEEYEEDIIEPRALNEITTMTDKTSPWSSVLSDGEQGADQQSIDLRPDDEHSVDTDCFRRGSSRRSSTFSSMLQGDNQSMLTTFGSCISLHADGSSTWALAEGFQSLSRGTEASKKELFQPAHSSEVHQAANGPGEDGNCHWDRAFNAKPLEQKVEFEAASKEQLAFPDVGLSNPKTTEREEEEEKGEVVNEDHQDKEESGSDEICIKSVSAQAGSEGNSESFSDDSSEDPLEESEESVKPKMVLSDPVVVPNFFLPPQQMEATMRLLSISSHPSTAPEVSGGARSSQMGQQDHGHQRGVTSFCLEPNRWSKAAMVGLKPPEVPPTAGVKFVSAGLAGCIADLCTFPLDTAKVRLQLQGEVRIPRTVGAVEYRGVFGTLSTMVRTEGPRSLYSGLAAGLQRQMSFASIRIGLYDSVKQLYTPKGAESTGLAPRVLAGCTTGAVAVACAQPTDVVKVRFQASGALMDGTRRYNGTMDAYRTIAREEGVRGLWRGTLPNIARNAIINCGELVTYDLIKDALLRAQLMTDNVPCHFVAAFGAGFCATVVASPVDVVKTRYMNAGPGQYRNALSCLLALLMQDGLAGFYKGFVPSFLRLGSWNVVMFVSYEQLQRAVVLARS